MEEKEITDMIKPIMQAMMIDIANYQPNNQV